MTLVSFKLSKSSLKPLLLCMLALLSESALAEDWTWHGFVSQGVIQARESNFVNNDGEVSARLSEVGLNSVYQIDSNLKLSGQLMYLNGGNRFVDGLRIDYFFLNWTPRNTLDWQLDLYS